MESSDLAQELPSNTCDSSIDREKDISDGKATEKV